MSGLRLGVIGAGNMATAIINAAVNKNLFAPQAVSVSDVCEEKLSSLSERGIFVSADNRLVAGRSDVLVLAVKPQMIEEVLKELSDCADGLCVVSIAAGVSTKYIRGYLKNSYVVRVMPNTPLLFGSGASAIAGTEDIPAELFDCAVSLFAASGEVAFIDEEKMNEIIGVNGSSPAYFFRMADAMTKAAEEQGIGREDALRLIAKTMEGAAVMLRKSGRTPAELTAQVTSPGGTTFAALTAFDEFGFEGLIREAMLRCTKRAYEIGK